jgi:hypothetical protein
MFQFNDYALIDSAFCAASTAATSPTSSAPRYTLDFTVRAAGNGNELLLSPFVLSRIYSSKAPGPILTRPLYRASMPVTLSQTLVVGASKEERSKSALILILHAQELPAATRRRVRRGRGRGEEVSEFPRQGGWPDGSIAEQAVMAADIGAARLEVERRGGHVFEVRRKGFSLSPAGSRAARAAIKMGEFLIFNQEMIALLKAGLPVVRSFEILLERQKSPVLSACSPTCASGVNSGASISEAFAEEGDLFRASTGRR